MTEATDPRPKKVNRVALHEAQLEQTQLLREILEQLKDIAKKVG